MIGEEKANKIGYIYLNTCGVISSICLHVIMKNEMSKVYEHTILAIKTARMTKHHTKQKLKV